MKDYEKSEVMFFKNEIFDKFFKDSMIFVGYEVTKLFFHHYYYYFYFLKL